MITDNPGHLKGFNEEVTVEVAKYILANPVRAGLAETVEQHPFVGSLVYELKDLISSTSS
jgi:hypothetical protein